MAEKQHKKPGRPQRTPEDAAQNGGDTCAKPRDWDSAVSAAYLRIMEWRRTRKEVATAVGVGERTLARWEISPWWRDAQAEAMERWCGGLIGSACKTVLDATESGDAQTARWALERLMPKMAPPSQKHELAGKDGGPLEVKTTLIMYPVNERDEPGDDGK